MPDTREPSPSAPPRDDVNNRGVLVSGAGLALAVVIAFASVWVMMRALERRQEKSEKVIEPQVARSLKRTPPEPRLEPDPLAPRRALRAREDAELSSYGWVDRRAGIVRIPIDRATAIVLEKGVPGGKPLPAGAVSSTPAAGPER